MGRSGRSGGSSRSSGGGFSGGGRSSGGFSGSRRIGGGFSNSRSSRSRSSSYNSRSGTSYRHYGYSGGYHGRGCGPVFVGSGGLTIFIVLVFVVTMFSVLRGNISVTRSTVERKKLPASLSHETSYYTDEVGWFTNIGALESGLKSFYKETGVQPHVYVTDGRYGTSIDELTTLAETTYDKLCSDEAHFVLVFYDDGYGSYRCGYTVGSQAKTIVDSEALSILRDYLDRYYSSDVSDEELFSKAFKETGHRIMTITKSPFVVVGTTVAIMGGVVAVTIIGFKWWKKAKAAKLKEAELTAEILNTPLEKMGDEKLEDLEEKYSNQ